MTYCCGILVRDGLVMIADTRTNAGLDNVSIFRKLHVFGIPGERILALASSGNLGLSQSVVSTLNEGLTHPQSGEAETLLNAPTMFQAAQRIGRTIRHVHELEAKALEAADVRQLLVRLSGRQMKRGCEFTEPALLSGLWVLLSAVWLLEHLDPQDLIVQVPPGRGQVPHDRDHVALGPLRHIPR